MRAKLMSVLFSMALASSASAQDLNLFAEEIDRPDFVTEEVTSSAARPQLARKLLMPASSSQFSAGQVRLLQSIADGTAKGNPKDAFPFHAYRLKPGTYRLIFERSDAALANKAVVGSVADPTQNDMDVVYGEVNNRGLNSATFTLPKTTMVRVAVLSDHTERGRGWCRTFALSTKNAQSIRICQEDASFDFPEPSDWDFDDLVVRLERISN